MIIKMSEANYRAMDKTHIYSSLLKTLHSESAMHLDVEREENDSFEFGSLAHMYTLEKDRFDRETVLQPEFNPISRDMIEKYSNNMENYSRTKECREQKQKFEDSVGGRTVVSVSDMKKLKAMLKSIKDGNIDLYNEYLTGGEAEYTIVNDKHRIGDKFYPVKVRIDYFINNGVITIVDLKTTQSASEKSFKRDIIKYGYDIQAAFYIDVVRQKFPGMPIDFLWLVVEKKPPFAFGWYRCSEETYNYGKGKYLPMMDHALQIVNGGPKTGYRAAYEIVSI